MGQTVVRVVSVSLRTRNPAIPQMAGVTVEMAGTALHVIATVRRDTGGQSVEGFATAIMGHVMSLAHVSVCRGGSHLTVTGLVNRGGMARTVPAPALAVSMSMQPVSPLVENVHVLQVSWARTVSKCVPPVLMVYTAGSSAAV